MVVAYSTMSQLGYMVMACGLGAYSAGMYHLLTHGPSRHFCFGLRLGHHRAASRTGHASHGRPEDKLPVTYWTFLVGSLALAGFPLTAGFFSKGRSAGLLLVGRASGSGPHHLRIGDGRFDRLL